MELEELFRQVDDYLSQGNPLEVFVLVSTEATERVKNNTFEKAAEKLVEIYDHIPQILNDFESKVHRFIKIINEIVSVYPEVKPYMKRKDIKKFEEIVKEVSIIMKIDTIIKYGIKRNSNKVGIIFVESPESDFPQQIHFLKIIEILFRSIENYLVGEDLNYIKYLKHQIICHQKRCFIPITGQFQFFDNINNWAFLMVMGSKLYEGLTVCFINAHFLNSHKNSMEKDIKWVKKLSQMYDYNYLV